MSKKLSKMKMLETAVDRLEGEVDAERMCIRMAVHRLGGMVEGAPTHAGNFLQRIDALVSAEAEVARLRTEVAAKELEAAKADSWRQAAEAYRAERDAAIRERDRQIRLLELCAESRRQDEAESAALRARLEEARTMAAEVCCSACGYQITGEEGRPDPECRACGPLLTTLAASGPKERP